MYTCKYIYIYDNTVFELPKLCYHPGWRLMRLGYRTCFHTLYDEKKKIFHIFMYILKYEYTYTFVHIHACMCAYVYICVHMCVCDQIICVHMCV